MSRGGLLYNRSFCLCFITVGIFGGGCAQCGGGRLGGVNVPEGWQSCLLPGHRVLEQLDGHRGLGGVGEVHVVHHVDQLVRAHLVEALLPAPQQHVALIVGDSLVPEGNFIKNSATELSQIRLGLGLVTPNHQGPHLPLVVSHNLGVAGPSHRSVQGVAGGGRAAVQGQEAVTDGLEVEEQLEAAQLGHVVVVLGQSIVIGRLIGETQR